MYYTCIVTLVCFSAEAEGPNDVWWPVSSLETSSMFQCWSWRAKWYVMTRVLTWDVLCVSVLKLKGQVMCDDPCPHLRRPLCFSAEAEGPSDVWWPVSSLETSSVFQCWSWRAKWCVMTRVLTWDVLCVSVLKLKGQVMCDDPCPHLRRPLCFSAEAEGPSDVWWPVSSLETSSVFQCWSWRAKWCRWCTASKRRVASGCGFVRAASASRTRTQTKWSTSCVQTAPSSECSVCTESYLCNQYIVCTNSSVKWVQRVYKQLRQVSAACVQRAICVISTLCVQTAPSSECSVCTKSYLCNEYIVCTNSSVKWVQRVYKELSV